MNILKDILYKVSILSTSGDMHLRIMDIQFDSRKVGPGSLFVAISGTQVDGHDYMEAALEKGALAIVCERFPEELMDDVTYIQVQDSAQALGIMAGNFYDNPSQKMKVVAVTGTNGKTTTATLMYQLFMGLGYKSGLFSTVSVFIGEEELPATHTTPDALQLHHIMSEMQKNGVTHVFMEASSHAIVQKRLAGLDIDIAVFSNISHDHLDYHRTFDEYIRAKKALFDGLKASAFALSNLDDKRGRVMLQNTRAKKYYYSLQTITDFRAKLLSNSMNGLELDIEGRQVWFRLPGVFNAYNLLSCYAVASLLEEEEEEILLQLSSLRGAPGRFELLKSATGVSAIVDYAHTPDALENVLKTIDAFRTGAEQLITVVGCGGDRDATKRPEMAGIAVEWSEKVIFTSDNPRSEDPEAIINEMKEGVPFTAKKKVLSITNREEAIRTAIMLANKGDLVLIAGKGHENYQEIKGVKHHFDDREVVLEVFKQLN
ncbi:MAG: UDP-N-acetylmuramoyl-L-alanyl-D-glutamate--2,6-diaminopimelate ligase [Cyclobacteriaceae bacterium]|nr:UDP-N-acetylmuramoyl-L-alanyl-D-glutamate--2,6-diaminopimelate ligase [Cyclobacteriaceae bacterium]MCH8516255.1 UDP-N-acetylmuramoyl-L-alanyl-D-glutamate--2,6-diaminopimelate ligase [Cyclobacteriaceae bacterium]